MYQRRRIAALVLLVCTGSFAATNAVTGKVLDGDPMRGEPVAGVTVKLAKFPRDSVITKADGTFSLIPTGVASNLTKSDLISKPQFKNNRLSFGVTERGQQVRIDVHTLAGKRVATLVNGIMPIGNYQVNPLQRSLAGQTYILKLQIGAHNSTFKVLSVGNGAAAGMASFGTNGAEGLAKSITAVSTKDTIIAKKAGCYTTRMAIPKDSGSYNVYLTGGTISIVNASYQGCQVGMYVAVADTDLTGATVPITVTTTNDATGITVNLRKIADQAGSYGDTVYFSIMKKDAATRTIKVLDQDRVFTTYTEALPSRIDSSYTDWTGNAANVGPGASMYTGLRGGMVANVYDPDVTDPYVILRVFSKDIDSLGVNGIDAKLYKNPGSPGNYTRKIGLSFVANVADSVLRVLPGANNDIRMYYQDLTPPAKVWGSILTWLPAPGNITLDSANYRGTVQKMKVSLVDDDILTPTAVVKVKSKKDPTGIDMTLTYTSTGNMFAGDVGFSTTASGVGTIAVQNNDSVTVTYQDDSPVKTVVQSAKWTTN